MTDIIRIILTRVTHDEGQTLAEYSLILAFVVIVSIAVVTALGLIVTGFFDDMVAGF